MGMTKQEKAKFHYDLINLLTDDDDSNDNGLFFEKLVYANQIISNCLIDFADDIYDYEEMIEEKWKEEEDEEY